MKIKLIALAVAALVSGAANAAIDPGFQSGNGNLIFTAWDDSSSYTLNTGYTIDSFQAALAANPNFHFSFTSALLTNWLSTAVGASYNVYAGDTVGAVRVITTTANDAEGTLSNQDAKAIAVTGANFINSSLNIGGPFASASVIEAVSTQDQGAYTGGSGIANYGSNFTNTGSITGNSSDVLSLIRIDAPNASATTASTSFAYAGTTAYLSNGTFNLASVAAVPEPETLAMLLAGIGLVGSIARRRNRNAA